MANVWINQKINQALLTNSDRLVVIDLVIHDDFLKHLGLHSITAIPKIGSLRCTVTICDIKEGLMIIRDYDNRLHYDYDQFLVNDLIQNAIFEPLVGAGFEDAWLELIKHAPVVNIGSENNPLFRVVAKPLPTSNVVFIDLVDYVTAKTYCAMTDRQSWKAFNSFHKWSITYKTSKICFIHPLGSARVHFNAHQ